MIYCFHHKKPYLNDIADKWGTKAEYTKLRKFLQRDGYIRIAPKTGVVRLLRLTEKQYNNIYMVTGEAVIRKKRLG